MTKKSQSDRGRTSKDLRSDIESMWKTTVAQFDELTDVLVKTSEAGRAKLDATMLRRERDQALMRLGALVRADRDKVEISDAWRAVLEDIDRLEARIADEDARFSRVFRPDAAQGDGVPPTDGDTE